MESNDSFDFILKHGSISYTHKGSAPQEGKLIQLLAPKGKLFKIFIRVQQLYEQSNQSVVASAFEKIDPSKIENLKDALGEVKDKKKEEDNKITEGQAEAHWQLIIGSDVDIDFFFDRFKALLVGGCALVEGEEPLTSSLWEDIHYKDKIRMVGWYIANFMVSSD